MKNQKAGKSVLAILLSLIMVFSVISPITAFAVSMDSGKLGTDVYLTSKTDYTVAPGVTESHITTNNSTGSNQVQGYALEVDLSNPTVSVISSYKDYDASSWGFQKVRDQAYAVESKLGVNVVAGVNGDFFNMQTGKPTGTFVMDGTVYTTNDNWNYFAILKDGTPVIGSGKLDTSNVKECIGGPCILVRDGAIAPEAVASDYGVDQLPRTAIGITAEGNIVLFVADGRQAPTSCGQTFEQLANSMLAMGCVDALSLDGGGSSTFISQHEGETELVCRNSPSDGAERTVSTALLVCSTAKPSGEFDHASLAPNNTVYTPGSSVQFTATGVDSAGYAASLPSDGTFALADDSYGTITADGVFTSNGKTGEVVVNYISDGKPCGAVSVEVQIPDELYVANTEQAVGPGVNTDFGIVAKYQNRDVVMKDGDIVWTIKDSSTDADLNGVAGTFSGLTFTGAEDNAYNAKVTATLASDTDLSLELTVFIGSKQITLYDFEYTTDDPTADNYIPSMTLPTYGAKWMSNNGYDHMSISAKAREDGYPLYMWPNGALTNDTVSASVVSAADGDPVRFGDKSLRIAFDFSSYNGSENGNFYLRSTNKIYAFEGSPTAIGVWVYAPEGIAGHKLYVNCARSVVEGSTKYGSSAYTTGATIDWVGWKYLELDLTGATKANFTGGSYAPYGNGNAVGVFWISYQPASGGNTTADTIWLDNMTVIYGANTSDTINPTVNYIGDLTSSTVDGETVYTSNTNTFKATYADVEDKYMTGIDDDATKMYIDGVDVTDKCYINEGDDEIYFYDAVLADGVHNIEIEVCDVFGNKTTEMRYFTIDSGSEDTEVSLVAVDGAPVLGMDYKLAVTSNNAADVTSADVKIKVLSDYTSYWRDVTVVPSANYELDGEAVYNSINDTLSFKVVRKADATAENDNGTIAEIVTAVPTNVPEGLEVTHRIAKGDITLATASDDKYTASFSGKITQATISPFVISTDVMVIGADGGYIYVTDNDGAPVEGANIYTAAGALVGVTDADGKLYTEDYVSAVAEFSIYAEKDGLLSFIYKTQSYNAGGDATGAPTYVKLNAAEDSATQQNISWMASPVASADKAIVKYATKADYEANGDATVFAEFIGESYVAQTKASGNTSTNYAVRFNTAVVTGLTPDTDYVYMVGDGTNWSALKNFSTTRKGYNTNFFVLGDTQSADTTNVSAIFNQLAASDTEYSFGLQTGDAVDNAGSYSYWEGIGSVFSGEYIGEIDMVHVLGNHEFTGDASGVNSAHYFNLPGKTDEAPLAYSFVYGNVYIAAISYASLDSYKAAAEWLADDAASTTANWKILSIHQPTYFTNVGANSDSMTEVISAAVDAADIDVVFSSHDHSYARTYPITAGEQAEGGTVYYICGATSSEKGYQLTVREGIHEVATNDYNAIYLTASATDTELVITTWNYDGTNHNEFDSCTITKEITCSDNGHVNKYDGEYLTCKVCGYTTEVGTYTGLVTNAESGKTMYLIAGNAVTGWFALGEDNYLFDENGEAMTGTVEYEGYTYEFGEDGKLTQGAFVKNSDGTYSYYINGTAQRGWFEIDGDWYYFSRTIGFKTLSGEKSVEGMMYTFASNGKLIRGAFNETSNGTTYYWGPNPATGLVEIDGELYYFNPENTYMVTGGSLEIDGKIYTFDDDGKFLHYDEHHDDDGNGYCDDCPEQSGWWRFLKALRDFFQKIIDFFSNLFGMK